MISSNNVPGRLLFGLAFVACAVAVKSGRIRNDLSCNCVQLLCVTPCVKCDSRHAKNEGSCRIKIALVAGFFPMKNPIFPCVISCVIYVSTIKGGSDTKRENLTHQKEKGLVNHRFTRPLCAQDRIRTYTPFRTLRPEHSASTNFATWASFQSLPGRLRLFRGANIGKEQVAPKKAAIFLDNALA
jgi:hypothetical protein